MGKLKNKMLLYGRISIIERLRTRPATIKNIFLKEGISIPSIEELANKNSISIERINSNKLQNLKPAKDLQGTLAVVEDFKYASLDEIFDKGVTFLLLDRINDPQNLGAIIRTCACFGRFAIVIPEFESCKVTEAVLHVASGGENYIPISVVPNIVNLIVKLKKKDYWVVGAENDTDTQDINKSKLPFPLALVLGSEGKGIRPGIQKHLDMRVRIPMEGAKLSFNVGIACGILCYEISRQRKA